MTGHLTLPDEIIDLVYSIAAFQHSDSVKWSADFGRVLRPGERGICHFAVTAREPVAYVDIQVKPIGCAAGIDDDLGRQHIATFRKPA